MRKIVQNDFIKKSVALVLAVAMVVTGLYIVAPEASEVKASTTNGVSAADVSATWGQTPTAPEEGVVFAGWYADTEYTQPLTEKPGDADGTVYYPKWVDEELLSLKLQIARVKGEDDTVKSYSLRLISSVDSLNYRQVGFYVYYDGSYVTKTTEYSALKEINAVNITTKYNYSPKVIDAEAERFFTVTLMGINPEKVGKDFQITPYWVTYDGVEETGETRMFSVEDGYDTKAATPTMVNNVNVAIPATITGDVPETVEVTVADAAEPTTASVVGYENGYLSVNVPLDRTTLASHTKIQYGDETVVYQNLLSKDTTDTSWYDTDTTADKFVLTTAADLRGFVSKAASLTTQEFYLVTDVDMDSTEWATISSFAGTFDGQGHTISGIGNASAANQGMFANASGKVQNFTLSNSRFRSQTYGGAVVGTLTGELHGIVADSSVEVFAVSKQHVGGLVGRTYTNDINKTAKITNCSFAGTISNTNTAGGDGGILGTADTGNCEMVNCEMSGIVTSASNAGGLVGWQRNAGTLTIRNCLMTGTVTSTSSNTKNAGTIIGAQTTSAGAIYLEDVYTAGTNTSNVGDGETETTGIIGLGNQGEGFIAYGLTESVAKTDITGSAAHSNLNLDFYSNDDEDGVWVATTDGLPKLKIAVTSADTVITTNNATPTKQYGWYYLKTKVTTGGTKGDAELADVNTYELETAGDLLGWNYAVRGGDTFSGDTVMLMDSVNLNPNWDASQKTTPSVEWLSVGSSGSFEGTFDGGNHTISGLYVSSTTFGRGMFATLTGTTIIKDFTLSNSYISGGNNVGAIAGTMQKNSELQNIKADDTVFVKGNLSVGGLVGAASVANTVGQVKMTGCSFAGSIDVTDAQGRCGGIIGEVRDGHNVTIDRCSFIGSAQGVNPLGGIVGYVRESSSVTITNSIASGTLQLTYANGSTTVSGQVGQIVGLLEGSATVTLTKVDSDDCVCYKADGTTQASRVRTSGTFTLNDNDQ